MRKVLSFPAAVNDLLWRGRFFSLSSSFVRHVAMTAVFLFVPMVAFSQTASTPPIPRASDGKPDFSGFWQVISTANWNIQDHSAEQGIPGGQGIVIGNEIPYQPWAIAKKKENYENRATADPEVKSYFPGVPRITYTPFPFQIVQTPKEIAILYEYVHAVRHLRTDGTNHPSGHIDWWFGDSRGHWDGDTLVVDVTDFNDQTWFDRAGNFHSDALHVVERYKFIDADHIDYEATIEDPKVFTKPWKIDVVIYRHKEKNFELLDYEGYAFEYEKYYP
ncbi:MAG: hypothetical protein ABSA96_17335 [Candidatus Acidiferrales bacterium]